MKGNVANPTHSLINLNLSNYSASLDAEELFRLQLQSIDNAKDNLGESGELEVTDIQVHLPPRVIAEDWEEEEEEASSNEEHQDFNRTVEILGGI